MAFIDRIKEKAASDPRPIVLPEATERRNLLATEKILQEKLARVFLVGSREDILAAAREHGARIDGATIVDPRQDASLETYIDDLYELRRAKGMTREEAREALLGCSVTYGVMMLRHGVVQGLVSGAIHATADILRPALQILKTAPGTRLVSAAFVMDLPSSPYGANGVFLFADSALNPNPSSEELAHIAISSARTFRALVGMEPVVAMLSFSTYGSAKHPDVDKVREAVALARQLDPALKVDGELQFDAAVVPEVGQLKAPQSPVAGKANVLIFPDLDAANIGYKIAQRLGGAEALGPVTQGIAKPCNDLSRGCSVDDIVGTVAITVLQAQMG